MRRDKEHLRQEVRTLLSTSGQHVVQFYLSGRLMKKATVPPDTLTLGPVILPSDDPPGSLRGHILTDLEQPGVTMVDCKDEVELEAWIKLLP